MRSPVAWVPSTCIIIAMTPPPRALAPIPEGWEIIEIIPAGTEYHCGPRTSTTADRSSSSPGGFRGIEIVNGIAPEEECA
jgi:hypothetical protein